MKKLKKLGAISFALIGGGALVSIPLAMTSCGKKTPDYSGDSIAPAPDYSNDGIKKAGIKVSFEINNKTALY
jgi:hypothetical protein